MSKPSIPPATAQILTKQAIDHIQGLAKTHFLNPDARRINKSLGDITGLKGLGFHLIEVPAGHASTELHQHHYEDECVYILEGQAEVTIGDTTTVVSAGDFIGYPANGLPHTMRNSGSGPLKCLVAGQRLEHEVVDYPTAGKRLFMNRGEPWNLVDISSISYPNAGKKS